VQPTRADRLRHLLALEVLRVMEDVSARRHLIVKVWSVHRHRWPMEEAAFSRWTTLRWPELSLLEMEESLALDAFYRALENFRGYVRRTRDMPLHLEEQYAELNDEIFRTGTAILDLLDIALPQPQPQADDTDAWFGLDVDAMTHEVD